MYICIAHEQTNSVHIKTDFCAKIVFIFKIRL